MPKNEKAREDGARETPKSKATREMTFSSFEDFDRKMFPNAVARRSLQKDRAAARELGERLAEALAADAERRISSRRS
jgi:hypothetical protein